MRRVFLSFAAAAVLAAAQTPVGVPGGAGPVFFPAAAGGLGRYYEVVGVPSGVTWSAAHAAALAAGGSLAAPATAAENAFVFGLIDQPQYWTTHNGFASGPWLGGAFSARALGWRFAASATPFPASAPWLPGQPDTAFGADRLHYSAPTPGVRLSQWDDAVETDGVVAFVVEWVPGAVCAAPTAPGFALCLAGSDAAGYRLQLFDVPAGTVEGRTLFSATPPAQFGTGGFLGLAVDPLLLTILFRAPAAGDVFSFTAGGVLDYPQAPFVLGPGNLGFLTGLTWDAAALVLDQSGTFHATPPVRVAW